MTSNTKTEKGTVAEVFPRMCSVLIETGEKKGTRLLCTYRRAQVWDRDAEWRERSPVATGDHVNVAVLGSKDGVIEDLEPRKNKIQRRAPGRDGKILHTLAANIDFVVIVASTVEPDFSPGLIDRFLVGAIAAEIAPVLVINKIDLIQSEPWKLYQDLGVRCYPISAKTGEGLNQLADLLRGKTSVFCGHSGVGKTSLLQNWFAGDAGKVGTVNTFTGKGKHTTTVSKLIEMPDGSRFIDTPGIKEFGLIEVLPEDLILYFPELAHAQERAESLENYPRFESFLRIKAALETEGR